MTHSIKNYLGSLALTVLAVSTLTPLSGCASGWVKAGATQNDFAVDQKACVEKAKASNDNKNWSGQYNEGIQTNKCLQELGWTRTDATTTNRAIASSPIIHK